MRKATATLFLLCAATLVACAADNMGTEDQDPGFDSWCGAEPCAWIVDEGEVLQVPTWHERDYGMELVGAPVQLHQDTEIVEQAGCVRYSFIADVEAQAEVTAGVDAGADGTVEEAQAVPASNWEPVNIVTHTEVPVGPVRFVIRKESEGSAVLAQIEIELTECD